MYKQMETKKSESGITLIALLVMIVILIILTAVVIRTITGDEPLIGTATSTAEDYKIESYREEISHVVHSEIISKSAVGETATTGDIAETLNEQEWVKTAIVNPEATAEVGNITVQVVEGYVYQVYYNSIYGKIEIDYIGKIDPEELNSFTLIARYEKSPASIYATAEDTKHGIAKLELIYKDELKQTKNNPSGEQKFDISEIGTGWYKVKATSKSGAVKYAWVKATNITDRLTTPEIRIETESTPKNGWYGADQKEVWIKISTSSPSAKSMHYTLSGAHTQAEKAEPLQEVAGETEKSIRFQITETGITNAVAWTQDETDKYQSEEAKNSIKYDNKAPEITSIEEKGTEGTNSWYKSEVELKINAKDLNGKPETTENAGLETLNGYNYTLLNEEGTELKSKTHITNIGTLIKTTEIAREDGIYVLHITAEDKAGNESPTKVVTLQKDTKPPTIGNPQVTNITETGFQLTISAGDTTSGVAYYEYYINDVKKETLTEGIWTPTGLQPNSINNVKVIVYDNAGNKTESINTPVTTKGELKAPDIQITGNTRNGYYIGDVTITVNDTSEANKTRVSKIKVTGAGSERTITGTSGSFTITSDGTYTISAWAEDAQGNKSDTTTKPAFTRDATAPSASLSVGSVGTYTISVTAYGSDSISGVKSYKFEYKKTSTSTWTTATTKTTSANSCTYTYSVPSDATTYNLKVTVTDYAGWTNVGTNSATTKTANTAPTVETVTFVSKTTDSITVEAMAMDTQKDALTYTLYIRRNSKRYKQLGSIRDNCNTNSKWIIRIYKLFSKSTSNRNKFTVSYMERRHVEQYEPIALGGQQCTGPYITKCAECGGSVKSVKCTCGNVYGSMDGGYCSICGHHKGVHTSQGCKGTDTVCSRYPTLHYGTINTCAHGQSSDHYIYCTHGEYTSYHD